MDPCGRSCPLAYRYRPEALAQPAQVEAGTLYVVGGLYGTPAALAAVLKRAHQEPSRPATIVFNGDVHWLDVDPDDVRTISERVLATTPPRATSTPSWPPRTRPPGAAAPIPTTSAMTWSIAPTRSSPGSGPPPGQFPELVGRLGELARHRTASVAGERVGICHGDPASLTAELLDWFGRAKVGVFASTHTGLPLAQVVADGGQVAW